MSDEVEARTGANVRGVTTAERAGLALVAWWSGYSAGASGDDLDLLLRRLECHLRRTLRTAEESEVRQGHASGLRDRREWRGGATE
ncbi:hypothetical protein [Frigoriglobus tundricola]|uniref:Uncharacterized protein n=1 Tax=Frigoriglobus tundricola TaxID=2774151 RepID=A0A6M5YM31_9BACT|nr:hypothetical protein [Frigoriglobus tundricola]QJW94985.1 hypothetical protein FTUN_2511 [Frigoriglobus tundricola]